MKEGSVSSCLFAESSYLHQREQIKPAEVEKQHQPSSLSTSNKQLENKFNPIPKSDKQRSKEFSSSDPTNQKARPIISN